MLCKNQALMLIKIYDWVFIKSTCKMTNCILIKNICKISDWVLNDSIKKVRATEY